MRPFAPVLALAVLAACHSSPAPAPLPLSSTFPVTYTGRVAPAVAKVDVPEPTARNAALAADGSTVFFKAIVVEMSRERARQWLPAASLRSARAAAPAEPAVLAPAGQTFQISRPRQEPAAASGLLGVVVSAQLLDGAMQGGQCELVTETSQIAARMDTTATITTEGNRAFVHALELRTLGSAHLISDPQVDVFAYGHRYEFTPRRDGELLQVDFAWHVAEPVWPVPIVQTPYSSLEVPMLVEHHLTGTATVSPAEVFVVGSLPGREADRVQLLCVAVGIDPQTR